VKKKSISEILNEVSGLKKKEDRVNLLRHHDSYALRTVLQGCFDSRVVWMIPEGVPPFRKSDLPDLEGNLYAEARKMYLFVKGGNDNLKPIRREQLFVQLLESLAPADADLVCSIKDRKMPYTKVTEEIVRLAFPDLLPPKSEANANV
jgi:hypothetical protein